MGGKDSVNLILEPRPLPHDLGAARHLPPHRLRGLVWNPHLGQEATRIELRKDRRIDLIRLHAGFSDQADLQGVGDNHFADMTCQHVRDGDRVAGRLEYHVVVGLQLGSKAFQLVASQADAPAGA